ncbi:MAG: DUF1295 domain-containing protein [Pseudomonadota bacterium]|nr:DUF1295 domain-containing protein [Pseudomonadota bacterium]
MGIKSKSLLICGLVYVVAFAAALITCSYLLHLNQWVIILCGHLIATIVVYSASIIYKNSSFYDPFWSVVPIPIVFYIAFWPVSKNLDYEKIVLFIIPILFWGIRLTFNWVRRWEGLNDEDFRYVDLKSLKFSKLIDFFGIHIYPTLQVNLSLLPTYYGLSISTNTANTWLYLASLFTFMAVILELVSDNQLWNFKKDKLNNDKFIDTGLWKFSRHPNYLGEVLFWWGIFFMLLSVDNSYWFLFICPLSMNLMFSLITCSMMDKRSLEKREGFKEYMSKTNQLIIWPFKTKNL